MSSHSKININIKRCQSKLLMRSACKSSQPHHTVTRSLWTNGVDSAGWLFHQWETIDWLTLGWVCTFADQPSINHPDTPVTHSKGSGLVWPVWGTLFHVTCAVWETNGEWSADCFNEHSDLAMRSPVIGIPNSGARSFTSDLPRNQRSLPATSLVGVGPLMTDSQICCSLSTQWCKWNKRHTSGAWTERETRNGWSVTWMKVCTNWKKRLRSNEKTVAIKSWCTWTCSKWGMVVKLPPWQDKTNGPTKVTTGDWGSSLVVNTRWKIFGTRRHHHTHCATSAVSFEQNWSLFGVTTNNEGVFSKTVLSSLPAMQSWSVSLQNCTLEIALHKLNCEKKQKASQLCTSERLEMTHFPWCAEQS